MTDKPTQDHVQAFTRELDQLCERHGLWLDTGGLDGLVRISPEQQGTYFGRRVDGGAPILCSEMREDPGERDLIVTDPAVRGGRPVIRGMRIAVSDVLGWLASGMSEAEILEEYPELTQADIRAALAFASATVDRTGR